MGEIIIIGNCNERDLIELSFSKSKTFMRCRKKYNYKYVEKLQRKSKSLPLAKGSWVHECLESHYKNGDWEQGYKNYLEENWEKLFEEEKVEFKELPTDVRNIMERYVKNFEGEEKDHKIVAVEQEFNIRIPGTKVVLTGVIDLISYNETGIWVTDHKTAKRIPDEEFRLTDTQLTIYYWVVNQLRSYLDIPKELEIAGVVFNYIRTKLPTEPDLLKKGGLTRRKDLDSDYETYMGALLKYGLDPKDYQEELNRLKHNKFFVRRQLPKSLTVVKETLLDMVAVGNQIAELDTSSRCVRNFTKDCSWDCEYKNLCIAELHGHDTSFIRETEFEIRERKLEKKEEEEN